MCPTYNVMNMGRPGKLWNSYYAKKAMTSELPSSPRTNLASRRFASVYISSPVGATWTTLIGQRNARLPQAYPLVRYLIFTLSMQDQSLIRYATALASGRVFWTKCQQLRK